MASFSKFCFFSLLFCFTVPSFACKDNVDKCKSSLDNQAIKSNLAISLDPRDVFFPGLPKEAIPDPIKDPTSIITPITKAIDPECRGDICKAVTEVSKNMPAVELNKISSITTPNNDILTILKRANNDTIYAVKKAKAQVEETLHQTANDTVATYKKGWNDYIEQSRRSLVDSKEAVDAIKRFQEREFNSTNEAFENGDKLFKEGKIVDALWVISIEPKKSSEKNFALLTQESSVVNAAAQSAAATYGGPGGAAAYAAWSTYKATGDANLAVKAGVLAAISNQTGGGASNMPSGTAGEIAKKSVMAGIAGGIAVAAAGGDENAIKQGIINSAGAVVIQTGTSKLNESFGSKFPKEKESLQTLHCISIKDTDCFSKTTYVRNAAGKILYGDDGKPIIEGISTDKLRSSWQWSAPDPQSEEGKKDLFIAGISKLPGKQAIPLFNNKWILTWTFGTNQTISYNEPSVILKQVVGKAPFYSIIKYKKLKHIDNLYQCNLAGITRKVEVTTTKSSCTATYTTKNKHQTVWHSDHELKICANKAVEFVKHLRALGMQCN